MGSPELDSLGAGIHVAVQEAPFDTASEIARLSALSDRTGGVGLFFGQVRGGNGLVSLTLEHYPGMTEKILHALAHEAVQRFGLLGCTLIHRVGTLRVGEAIVFVGASAAHRGAALDATAFLIDRLKTGAPFWKKEEFADGHASWVAAREEDEHAARAWSQDTPPPA
ncbi:molybdenum cofactor biosynthesis protein MoaE [Acetobacter sp. TBRC 12305]|uniref:Molybdopterin synthase catalytic subunit n=1 Tax=Acetobacter garciniae TaxID=2817435 RepID=A0A939HM39_9PROT|nr:molybdenum cofactor biosynthesis protein MoaE [Acetobacter garciniae]MBO1324078.1 molybdenum cofactor biosynthesis protein MoaE [Acetobacter garciniae]MBX0343767.1 molybdenum cofactor biosynthesis protein MoaE [Acetobacter garciniae]